MSATKKKPKNLSAHLIAGGIAGGCEALTCHPLDTIKVRLQLRGERTVRAKPLSTVANAAAAAATKPKSQNFIAVGVGIVQKEGFLSLYKGLGAVFTGIVPKMAIRFSSFEYFQSKLAGPDAGLLAGATESVAVVTPMDVIKIRLQAQRHSMTDPLDIPKYRNAAHCAYVMIKEEGFGSLYKGVTLTIIRQGTNQAANFTVYHFLKDKLMKYHGSETLPSYETLVVGFISGACGPLFNAPVDTIKTRIQKNPSTENGFTRAVNISKNILQNEGWTAFYRGLTPRVLRVAPGQSIVFVVYERVYKWISEMNAKVDVGEVEKAAIMEQTDVAVKVLHPGVKAMVENDLKIMLMVATALEYIIPELHWLSLPDEVSMFSKMMQQQLDLRIESDNLITFIDNFGKWKQVGFPQPLQSTMNLNSHSDILIETWIDGIPLDHFLKWGPSTFDKKIATIGLTAFLLGNILVSFQKIDKDNFNSTPEFVSKSILMDLQHISNPSDWKSYLLSLEHEYEPFLYFIDAGLVSNLSSTHFTNFLDLFKAVTEFDGQMISKLMVQRSKTPSTVRDFAGFSYSMGAFMKRIKKNTLALGEIYVSEILQFVFQTVRQHHVKIDGDFANVAVAILLLEGIGRQLGNYNNDANIV
ncbi:hypothetical protein HDV02_004872 [Globomyces sp. JEL0801]|nr:hypothetical protein HDV02_004872 [Globomyces sp. JEL0801]